MLAPVPDMRTVITDLQRWTEEQRRLREQLIADLRAATTLTDRMRVALAPQDEIRESAARMRANSLPVVDSARAVSNMLVSATESLRPLVEQIERDRQQLRSLVTNP